jgi:hypothetical protein
MRYEWNFTNYFSYRRNDFSLSTLERTSLRRTSHAPIASSWKLVIRKPKRLTRRKCAYEHPFV